jgi:type I restriction enzyme R subunit
MTVLRDTDFLALLKDFPRAERTFIVASGVTDTVESKWLIKAGIGKEYKPDDYLKLFEQFIDEHVDEIHAVRILLSKPADWGAGPLKELREALNHAPEHFTEANHKALVDIISMVKRAATETSPLLTAEERVNAAVAAVSAGRSLTEEQNKWMEYIRQHLVQNLSIEPDDFDIIPVLADRGGWGKANRTFDGRLSELLDELNKELVAA